MNVAIRGEERRSSNIRQDYEDRKRELENQRKVVSNAPELLNVAIVVDGG